MSRVTINRPAKADSLTGFNDIVDTFHNFFDMLGEFDFFAWWLSFVELLTAIRGLIAP